MLSALFKSIIHAFTTLRCQNLIPRPLDFFVSGTSGDGAPMMPDLFGGALVRRKSAMSLVL